MILRADAVNNHVSKNSRRPLMMTILVMIAWLHAAAAQPVPSTSLGVPAATNIGEEVDVTVVFDNTGDQTGYGPFIDLVLATSGIDGSVAKPGVGLDFLGAEFSSTPVGAVVGVFPDDGGGSGCIDHPYAVDTAHAPLEVCGPAGDTLVTVLLPFGSFVVNQPPAAIVFRLKISNLADLGAALPVSARGGFQFGNDPLDNPCCDLVILDPGNPDSGTWPSASITPTLMTLAKTYSGPENETATGPNFLRRYTVSVDIADGQTVTDLELSDVLPGNLQFVALVETTVHGAPVATTAVATPSTTVPGGTLTRRFTTVTGNSDAADAVMVFTYFVPRLDGSSNPVNDPASGNDATSPNQASASGDWDPVDPRDPVGAPTAGGPGPEHTLAPKSIAIQKGVGIAVDTGAAGASPGDTLEYTLSFQISDFFAFENLVLDDTFSDGQRLTGVPSLSLTRHGSTSSGPVDGANFTAVVDSPGTGSTNIVVRVSDELALRLLDPRVPGGCVPAAGTGGPAPDCAVFNGGATTAVVTFRTVIQDAFTDTFPSGDPSVDHGDVLGNAVTLSGDVLNVSDLTATGSSEDDGSGASIAIELGRLDKTIYAINGSTTLPSPLEVYPGDTITYRLQYTLPSSDFEDLQFVDYLPLPVFDAGEVAVFDDAQTVSDATLPAAGRAKFGPGDTFRALAGAAAGVPVLATDPAAPSTPPLAPNTVSFGYGDFDNGGNVATEIDILFTVTVTDQPFADRLYLTNQVFSREGSTNAGDQEGDEIVQITLREPYLQVTKGACTADNPDAVFDPASPVCPDPTSGTFSSTDLAAANVDADLGGVDAGDVMTFTIVIENTGGSGAFDIVVRDIMPPGFGIPGAGLGLTVVRGDGFMPVLLTTGGAPLADPADLFGAGIQLDDSGGQPLCQPHDPAAGSNVLVVTYQLEVTDPTLVPASVHANQGGVTEYAGEEGGTTHVDPTDPSDFTDEAEVTTALPRLVKTFVGTEIASPNNPASRAVIGEFVTYRLELTVPEGLTPDALITDTLDNGLSLVDVTVFANPSADVSVQRPITTGANPANVGVADGGRTLTFNLGNLTNANRNNAADEVITIEYRAVVLNTSGNNAGNFRNNSAVLTWNGGGLPAVRAANIRLLEPLLEPGKSASPTSGDAGNVITFSLAVTNLNGTWDTDAFDVQLRDVIPAGLTYVAGSLATGICTAPPSSFSDASAPALVATWVSFPKNTICELTYQATLDPGVNPDQVFTNTVDVDWSSLFGAPGQRSVHNTASVERDGSGGVNDYADSDTADVTVISPGLAKTVVATSETATGTAEHDGGLEDLAIGETATFHITATLPEGITPQVTITDSLPANATGVLSVVSARLVSIGGNLTAVTDPPTITISDLSLSDSLDDTVAFAFGQVANAADGLQNADDTIVVEVVARAHSVPANADSDVLTNAVLLQYGTGLQASASLDVEVVEPQLTVSKSATPTSGDAGDTIGFSITVQHLAGSTQDAFDVSLSDTIPAGMTYSAGSLDCTGGSATPDLSCSESGGVITAGWSRIDRGDDSVITFNVTLDTDVQPEQVITNTAAIGWDTLDAAGHDDDREYTAGASAQVTITEPGMAKTVVATSVAQTGSAVNGAEPDLTIGEQVTYEIVVTLPEGLVNSSVVVDDLPVAPGVLEVVSSEIVSFPADVTGTGLQPGDSGVASDRNSDTRNDRVTFNLGALTNPPGGASNDIVLRVTAVVPDVAANQGGLDDLVNTAGFTYAGGGPVIGTTPVDLVEPEMSITKTNLNPFGDAGDTLTYRIRVTHTAASNATANDVAVVDTLPAGQTFQTASVTAISGPAPVLDTGGLPGAVTFSWASLATADSPVEFTYQVVLDQTVEPAVTYTNTANLSWDSLPSGIPGDGGDNDREGSDADSADVTINAPALTKITDVTSLDDTGAIHHDPTLADLAIGETVTYSISVTIPEGTTANAQVTDALQADANGVLEAIGARVVSIGGLTTTQAGSPSFADNALGDGLDDTVIFDFGDITNPADGVIDDGDRIVLEVTARVVDVADNADGDSLVNLASLSYDSGPSVDDTADLDVVEPSMGIVKTLGPAVDGVVTVTVQLANSGTAPAYDIEVADVMSSSVWDTATIAPLSVPAGFTLTSAGAPGDATVTLASDTTASPANLASIEPGETVVFSFTSMLATPLPSTTVTNTATNTETSTLPGDDPGERDEPDVQDSDQLELPLIEVDKSAALAPGGDSDGSGTVSPGDILRYTVTTTNSGTAAATNVVLVDPISDPNLELAVGSVTAAAGGVVVLGNGAGDSTVEVAYASVAAASSVAVTFDVLIAPAVAAGVTAVVNWANVASDEQPDEPSDDPGTPADDDPTVVPLDAVPNIAVSKTDGVVSASPGDSLTYTITVENIGTKDATGVLVRDVIPARTFFVSASDGGGEVSAGGGVVVWPLFDLAAGFSVTRTVEVEVGNPLPIEVVELVNSVTAEDDGNNGADPDISDNSDTDIDTVVQLPYLQVFKTASSPSNGSFFQPGQAVTWTIVIENTGGAAAADASLSDTVPDNTTYLPGSLLLDGFYLTDAADGDVGSFEEFSNTVVVDAGPVPAGGARTVTFSTTITTIAPHGDLVIANQALVDSSGETYPSDDPDTFDEDDPTVVDVSAVGIPVLGLPSQLVLVLLMAMAGLLIMKRN